MARLIDIDKKIIVPIVDETKGGMVYEAEMTVGEFFAKFLPDYQPEIVEAIPVEWLIGRANDIKRAPLYRRFAKMLIDEWHTATSEVVR